jgi:acetolactate synthase-1/2/3 large subunit
MGISRPIVKHSFQVRKAERYSRHGQEGVLHCRFRPSGPGGDRHSEGLHQPQRKVPVRVPEKVKLRSYNPPGRGHAGQIRKAIDELRARPNVP